MKHRLITHIFSSPTDTVHAALPYDGVDMHASPIPMGSLEFIMTKGLNPDGPWIKIPITEREETDMTVNIELNADFFDRIDRNARQWAMTGKTWALKALEACLNYGIPTAEASVVGSRPVPATRLSNQVQILNGLMKELASACRGEELLCYFTPENYGGVILSGLLEDLKRLRDAGRQMVVDQPRDKSSDERVPADGLSVAELEDQYDAYKRLCGALTDLVIKLGAGDGFYGNDPVELVGDIGNWYDSLPTPEPESKPAPSEDAMYDTRLLRLSRASVDLNKAYHELIRFVGENPEKTFEASQKADAIVGHCITVANEALKSKLSIIQKVIGDPLEAFTMIEPDPDNVLAAAANDRKPDPEDVIVIEPGIDDPQDIYRRLSLGLGSMDWAMLVDEFKEAVVTMIGGAGGEKDTPVPCELETLWAEVKAIHAKIAEYENDSRDRDKLLAVDLEKLRGGAK